MYNKKSWPRRKVTCIHIEIKSVFTFSKEQSKLSIEVNPFTDTVPYEVTVRPTDTVRPLGFPRITKRPNSAQKSKVNLTVTIVESTSLSSRNRNSLRVSISIRQM